MGLVPIHIDVTIFLVIAAQAIHVTRPDGLWGIALRKVYKSLGIFMGSIAGCLEIYKLIYCIYELWIMNLISYNV